MITEVCMKGSMAPIIQSQEGKWIHPEMEVGCDYNKPNHPWFAWCEVCGNVWYLSESIQEMGITYPVGDDGSSDLDHPMANEWLINVLRT